MEWIRQALQSLRNKIIHMIERAIVTEPKPVVLGEYPSAQVQSMKKTVDIENISPYGLASSLPLGALCVMYNIQGESGNKVGTGYDPATLPALQLNEVAVGNFSGVIPTYLKFTNLGTIEVWKAGLPVIKDLITHIHTGGTLSGGLTGPPNP